MPTKWSTFYRLFTRIVLTRTIGHRELAERFDQTRDGRHRLLDGVVEVLQFVLLRWRLEAERFRR